MLHNSNRLAVQLQPCDVLARVAPRAHQGGAEFEVQVASRLAETGAPVGAARSSRPAAEGPSNSTSLMPPSTQAGRRSRSARTIPASIYRWSDSAGSSCWPWSPRGDASPVTISRTAARWPWTGSVSCEPSSGADTGTTRAPANPARRAASRSPNGARERSCRRVEPAHPRRPAPRCGASARHHAHVPHVRRPPGSRSTCSRLQRRRRLSKRPVEHPSGRPGCS